MVRRSLWLGRGRFSSGASGGIASACHLINCVHCYPDIGVDKRFFNLLAQKSSLDYVELNIEREKMMVCRAQREKSASDELLEESGKSSSIGLGRKSSDVKAILDIRAERYHSV